MVGRAVMLEWVKKHFRPSQVLLHHERPRDFSTTSWQRDRAGIAGAYVAYRFAAAGLYLGILVAAGTTSNYPSFFFIYLTHHGLILQTLYLILSAALLVQQLLDANNGLPPSSQMSVTAKITWLLYNITNVTSLIITFLYWGFVFNPDFHKLHAVNVMIHALNTVTSLGDIFISNRPCRLMHFYQPIAFLVLYSIFSAIYWAAGGLNPFGFPYIYSILDWSNPSRTIPFIVIGLLVGLPLIHGFVWVLHKMRDSCLSRMITTASSVSSEPSVKA